MRFRVSRFAQTGKLNLSLGANRFMGWASLSLIRWEWKLNVYFTV